MTSAEVSHRVSVTNERLKQSNELQEELLDKQKEAFQSLSKLHEEEERMQQHMQMFVLGFKEFRWYTLCLFCLFTNVHSQVPLPFHVWIMYFSQADIR